MDGHNQQPLGGARTAMNPVSGPPIGPYVPQEHHALDGGPRKPEAGRDVTVSRDGRAARTDVVLGAPTLILDQSHVEDRIDALIDGQVAAGRITGDQAGVLRHVLHAPAIGATGIIEDKVTPASNNASTASDNDGGEASGARDEHLSASDTLASFIRHVQQSQITTVGYGSDGARSSELTSSRLLDFNT